jgi:large subunit ribosomal protein L5
MSKEDKDKKDKEHGKDAKPKAEKHAGGEGGKKGGDKGEKGDKKFKRPAATAKVEIDTGETPTGPIPTPRLVDKYKNEVIPAMQQKFGYKNAMAIPKLDKLVISMGVGKYATLGGEGKAKIEQAERELTVIAGQKPIRCKAKKSVANFKVREGMETGLKVTLRGKRMYEFVDRLISLAFPRVKDFRGIDPKGFDKSGNFNFGFNEQTVFPEVDATTVTFQQGMNITMVTTAKTADEGRELLKQFGMPFRDDTKKD